MAEVASMIPGSNQGIAKDGAEQVYFHSGSEVTYRKVSEKASGFTTIPTVDLTHLDGTLSQRKAIAADVYKACHECGFFYIKNHGIPQEAVTEAFQLLKRFFALDIETKMDAHVQKNPAIRGYEPMLETKLDPRTQGDIKEAFTMGDCVIEPEQDYTGRTGKQPPGHITQPQNIWPEKAPWWRDGVYKYYQHVFPLAMKLVRIFALAFGLEETAFDQRFQFPITGMRPLYYPPTPVAQDAASVGLGAHADFSWLTLVLQQDGIPALEVLNPDGVWVDAPPIPGTLVCNVGQYMERQTNGLFPATVHRVRNKTGQERYSLPFFLTMDPDVELNVLESCVEPGEKPEFDRINVGDLYIRRVLPARKKHPTSIKYRDIPQEQWSYQMLLS
ncbi:hypothetical protein LQW54_003856 [Pestalotiopsis sp. IQ-011]